MKFYPTIHNKAGQSSTPWFEQRGENIYSTIHNPAGHSSLPQFTVHNNSIRATAYNRSAGGSVGQSLYTIRDSRVYQTRFHPDGPSAHPVFHIRN